MLSGANYQVSEFVYLLGPCGPLQWTLPWDWEFLPPLQPPQNFTARGFEALFPLTGTLGCTVCLAPQFLSAYPHAYVGLPSPSAATFSHILCPQLPVPALPTNLDECFFFNSFVGLPYSSIFWQFWLFFAFKLVVVLLWVVQGSEAYLSILPSCPEVLASCLSRTVLPKSLLVRSQCSYPQNFFPVNLKEHFLRSKCYCFFWVTEFFLFHRYCESYFASWVCS